MTEYQDRRMKSIIFTMASSGIRLGAWDYLRWKDIEPISKNGRVVAAKITVYAGEEDEYFSFVTPEAFHELEKWICYRKEEAMKIPITIIPIAAIMAAKLSTLWYPN